MYLEGRRRRRCYLLQDHFRSSPGHLCEKMTVAILHLRLGHLSGYLHLCPEIVALGDDDSRPRQIFQGHILELAHLPRLQGLPAPSMAAGLLITPLRGPLLPRAAAGRRTPLRTAAFAFGGIPTASFSPSTWPAFASCDIPALAFYAVFLSTSSFSLVAGHPVGVPSSDSLT